MKIVEFGKENEKVVIFLHGGGLSWWNYRKVAEHLKDYYHIVIPVLDGHSGSDRDFTSIEDQAKEIIEHIDKVYNGEVELIGGLSLGGQVLVEILRQRGNICRYAIIESALVIPMKVTNLLVRPMLDMSYWMIRKRWFAKLQFCYLKLPGSLFDEYYEDTCKITKENMITILKANSSYCLKNGVENIKAKTYIFVGGKESYKIRASARKLNCEISDSELEMKDKWWHGCFSLNHSADYVCKVKSILGDFN